MWAFLVITLVLAVRASDTNNNTEVEEQLDIARGKLLVSIYRNPGLYPKNLHADILPCLCSECCDIGARMRRSDSKQRHRKKTEVTINKQYVL